MKKFKSLEVFRKIIDEIDLKILDLIEERKDLVTEVVKLKMPVMTKTVGLDSELLKEIQ